MPDIHADIRAVCRVLDRENGGGQHMAKDRLSADEGAACLRVLWAWAPRMLPEYFEHRSESQAAEAAG